MDSPISDLAPDIAALLTNHWRTIPVWRKLADVDELNEALKILALSDLRRRYPYASDAQLQRRLAERWLGVDLATRVYGPMPEDDHAAN